MSEKEHIEDGKVPCPVCDKLFSSKGVEDHVNKCLFLNTKIEPSSSKRLASVFTAASPQEKKIKLSKTNEPINNTDAKKIGDIAAINAKAQSQPASSGGGVTNGSDKGAGSAWGASGAPLAERMRPSCLAELVGQEQVLGAGSMLRHLLERNQLSSMILWGPPGCGKTSLANVVANMCKEQSHLRFVKLSAASAGINDVKEVVKVAKNELRFKRQTVLFMDEIHRFNKLQQDVFLPHVESGTVVLLGATTENPSFSLNNALLSRCRVVVMEKLGVDDIMTILVRALNKNEEVLVVEPDGPAAHSREGQHLPRWMVESTALHWLAGACDGDARAALGGLELALRARDPGPALFTDGPAQITLTDVQEGLKRSHTLYDRGGDEHYNLASALHKSIRASDDNAALYWTARMLHGGEDPLYIARRLVRAASEDIGLADDSALVEAVACLQGCQQLGMPECDVLLAQCAVRLARAPKSQEVYCALKRAQSSLRDATGPLPPVPLHLRNAPTRLLQQLGYGRGYNMRHRDESGLEYLPDELCGTDFFSETGDSGG